MTAEPVWRAITDSPRLTRRRLVGLVAASVAAGLVAGCDGERLSYALSIGITNSGLFREIIAFSPGFMAPAGEVDRPRIYISHGVHDQVLPIDHERVWLGMLYQALTWLQESLVEYVAEGDA